jgi:hypothetical protein
MNIYEYIYIYEYDLEYVIYVSRLVGDFFDVELCLMEDFSRIVASIFCWNGVKFGSPNNEFQK